MSEQPIVYVVDDDPEMRASLSRLLGELRFTVQTFESGEAFLAAWTPDAPGCVLLDVRMPGMSGLELQRRLRAFPCGLPVIVISGHGDLQLAVQTMRDGAVDFLEKPFRAERLLERIREALARSVRERQEWRVQDQLQRLAAQLTPREREVAQLVLVGLTNKEIAVRLGVSSQAIDSHRARLFRKLQVNNVVEFVRFALRGRLGGATVESSGE